MKTDPCEKQHQFLETIEPIVRHKVRIAEVCIPTYRIDSNGNMETIWPKEAQEMFNQCDRWIAEIAKSFEREKP